MANPMALLGTALFQAGSSGVASGIASPFTQPISYAANYSMPVMMPDPDSMVNSFFQGFSSIEAINLIYRIHGRNLNADANTFEQTRLTEQGISINPDYIGKELTLWEQQIRSFVFTPTLPEIYILNNRGVITDALANHWISRQTGNDPLLTGALASLKYEIPGPSDLVRFAVREAFSPQIVQQFGYNKEIPSQAKEWMNKQGYGGRLGFDLPPGTTDENGNAIRGATTWSDLYWFAHWELPSLTQGYEMVHRLYPASDFGPSPDILNNATFTEADLRLLQKAQDLPEYWRDRLQAISYHTIDKIDAERLFENNLIEEGALYHVLRSKGYNDGNSKQLISLAKLRRDRNLGIEPGKVSRDWVCSNYKHGAIADNNAIELIQQTGFTRQQSEQFLQRCKLEIQSETLKQQMSLTRLGYLRGMMNTESLSIEFNRLGINPWIQEQMITRWRYQREFKIKPLSALQNIKLYRNGVITSDQLQTRLYNLGYPMVVVTQLINDADKRIQAIQIKLLDTQAKRISKENIIRQKELLKITKQKVKEVQTKAKQEAKIVTNKANKRLREFIKVSSDANLKKWYQAGLIELWEVYYRLFYKGYNKVDAFRWVETNLKPDDKEKNNAAAKKGETQYGNEGYPPVEDGNPE